MFNREHWQEIFFTIRKNKLRTILTSFGVFWGIFMLVCMMGAGSGLENAIKKGFEGYGANSMYVWGTRTTVPYRGHQPGRFIRFNNSDILAIKNKFNEIEAIAPRFTFNYPVTYKNRNENINIRGEAPEILKIEAYDIVDGRFINTLDFKEKRKVVVIGSQIKKELFDEKEAIGEFIKVSGVYFKVIGIMSTERRQGGGMSDVLRDLITPMSTFQQAFNVGDQIGYFACLVKPQYGAEEIENKLKLFLSERHDVSPEDQMGIGSFNLGQMFNRFSMLFFSIRLLIWIVGIGTLMAGIVGVSNIMLIIVNDRTKEIGIRKSLGAAPTSVVSMIIQESVFLTFISGLIGLVIGVVIIELARIVTEQIKSDGVVFHNPEVNLNLAVMAVVMLVLTGVLAGLIPSLKAARIKPIEALRQE